MRLPIIYKVIPLTLAMIACSSNNTLNSTWMADNQKSLGNKKLNQLIIPGSHFSNAYGLSNNKQLIVCNGETFKDNMSNNAKLASLINGNSSISQEEFVNYLNTQNNNITGQLNNGVRYLELQICLQNANYYTSNYYLTDSLDSIIKQIKDFIDDNPKELIIIDLDNNIRSDYGYMTENDINILHNYLQMQFGSYLTPRQNWQNLTLEDIWATKHRIILLSANPNLIKYYDVWNKNEFVNEPEEASYTTIKKLTLIQKYAQAESGSMTNNLKILPIYSDFNPQSNTLNQLSKNPNDHLILDYLYSLPAKVPLNIIVSDRQYNRQLVDFAIYKNLSESK